MSEAQLVPAAAAPVSARRVIVGIVLAAVGLGSVASPYSFALLVTAIAFGCLYELARLVDRKGATLVLPVAVCASVAYLWLAAFGRLQSCEGTLLACTTVGALAWAIIGTRDGYLARSGATVLAVLYIGKLLSYFIAIRLLPDVGIPLTVLVICIVAFTDIFAMLTGRLVGRTPLTSISPKKTVEGALGGAAAAAIAGAVFGYLQPLIMAPWLGAAIGFFVSCAAQLGDLVESAVKRDASVKDAGTAFSDHGGVLDRFDSYLFGGIAFYGALWLARFIPHGS